ncbi:MAG: hypothetical protein LBL57_03530, partial [Tannerella sp.]|nr:hypothetical protein [Tannerella sp.]
MDSMNSMKRINLYIIAAILLLTVTTRNATAQTQRPGGVNNPNYTWLAWLTPDSYNNGVWTNLIQGSASVGDFTRQDLTPPKINSGYNFHPSVNFPFGGSGAADLSGRYWMLSANNTPGIETSDNMTVVIVMKRSTANNYYDYLLGLSNESGVLKGSIGWRNAGSTLTWRWGGYTETDLTMPSISEGILVLDNANDASNKFNYYLNGSVNSDDATEQSLPSQKIAVASGRNETGSVGYEGTIQEIIILKANGETDRHLRPLDLQKIHSSLAIKYGFTLSNGDNYVNSAGQSVWDRTANAGYGYHITGIARDDASGLYQKQSKSINAASLLTVFVGSNVAALNSSNGGQLPNGVYAMFGSNNGNINTVENLLSEIPVAPGSTLTVNYLKGLKYKAQLTGAATQ